MGAILLYYQLFMEMIKGRKNSILKTEQDFLFSCDGIGEIITKLMIKID